MGGETMNEREFMDEFEGDECRPTSGNPANGSHGLTKNSRPDTKVAKSGSPSSRQAIVH